jgi:glycosyltransferase involved in cell wall biosynthesis
MRKKRSARSVDRPVTPLDQHAVAEPARLPRARSFTSLSSRRPRARRRAERVPGRPLRIAHINANFAGGSGGIMLREASGLDPERFTTTILAPGDGPLFSLAERRGVQVVRLQRMGGGRHVYPWADGEALRELCEVLRAGDYDLVHTHAGRAGAVGRIAARRVGVPAIVHTLHGFPFNEFQSPATRRALQALERRLGRITDWFLTDGTFVASEAVRLKIAPPDRIRALISPIDRIAPVTEAAREDARRRLGLTRDLKVIGTTARLARQKGPIDMVDAIAALGRRDVRMLWVGDGELRPEVERRIADHGLGDRFILLGDRDDVPDLLPAFDVLAMSSLWEGLPCSVIEAMTCGIPVVSTAVNSVPEVVIPGRTGLLARPQDPSSLSRALAYMLDHPDEAARMAAAAREQMSHDSRPEALGDELAGVYESALRSGAREPREIAA